MKRVKAACICQTLHFMLKEDVAHAWAVKQCQQDVEQYKKILERNRTQYKIVEETVQPDGSVEGVARLSFFRPKKLGCSLMLFKLDYYI